MFYGLRTLLYIPKLKIHAIAKSTRGFEEMIYNDKDFDSMLIIT